MGPMGPAKPCGESASAPCSRGLRPTCASSPPPQAAQLPLKLGGRPQPLTGSPLGPGGPWMPGSPWSPFSPISPGGPMSPIKPAWPWGQKGQKRDKKGTKATSPRSSPPAPSPPKKKTPSHLLSLVAGVSFEAGQSHGTLQEAKGGGHVGWLRGGGAGVVPLVPVPPGGLTRGPGGPDCPGAPRRPCSP